MDHHFQIDDRVWIHICKDQIQGEGRKLKPIRYGPFKILDQVGNNAFRLNFPPYMQIYFVVNVENLKLYEPPMIVDQDVQVQVPFIDDFSLEYLNEVQDDVMLDKKVKYSQRGDVEYLRVGLK